MAKFEDFSIGEEQTESAASALAWSPPGIGRHGRCALAVLTSNLLLSIWIPTADHADASCWKRGSIVNNAIRRYLEGSSADGGTDSSSISPRARIRAFAWSPILSDAEHDAGPSAPTKVGLLALLNECAEILICRVDGSSEWAHETSIAVSLIQSYTPTLSPVDEPRPVICDMQWLPSHQELSNGYSFLEFTTRRSWYSISLHSNKSELGESTSIALEFQNLTVSSSNKNARAWYVHKAQVAESDNDYLSERVDLLKSTFDEEHDLHSQVSTRYWGSCTYKQFEAIHITIHPSTMIQYITPANEVSHIVFSHKSLANSSQDSQSLIFDWESPVASMPQSEACSQVWHFLLEHFPLVHAIQLTKKSSGNAIDHVAEQPREDKFHERVCRRLVYAHFCSALAEGWTIDARALQLVKWAMQLGEDNQKWFEETLASLSSDLIQNQRVTAINDLSALFVDEEARSCLEYCEFCGQRVLWKEHGLAQCVDGHCLGITSTVVN